jgi:hypothetical protein
MQPLNSCMWNRYAAACAGLSPTPRIQHQAGKRFKRYFDQGRIPIVLHLADHDPNGIDMTRDNIERLALYARQEVEVRRIALNME